MTWSLQVQHGDLVLGGAKLGVVSAESKLIQDLSHWLLEHLGSDPLHPEHGSKLDAVVGEEDMHYGAVLVESDIRRVISEYQTQQLVRAKADRLRYNKATLTAGEVVVAVNAIDMQQTLDRLDITIHLTTAAGQSVTLDIPVPANNL